MKPVESEPPPSVTVGWFAADSSGIAVFAGLALPPAPERWIVHGTAVSADSRVDDFYVAAFRRPVVVGTIDAPPFLRPGDRAVLTATFRRQTAGPEPLRFGVSARGIHVAGWAKRFLFRSEQLETPVGRLSGGEQARVLLARLMLAPADVLLLDEPTNDLDIPTLEVLEESLLEFAGALVLVTHDRYLLDRVSTRILALDGRGGAQVYADYAQWEAARAETVAAGTAPPAAAPALRRTRAEDQPTGLRRLTYRERIEWEGMEAAVLQAEAALDAATAAAHDPSIASDAPVLHEAVLHMNAAQAEVDRLVARWAELEARQHE